MNLNIQYLLNKLANNTQEILDKIHNDPKLTKRQCPITGLYIANAAKDLFTPTEEHQLFAKGIIYEVFMVGEHPEGPKLFYKLIALGFLKIYNFGENQWANQHVNEMINIGAEPVYCQKLDGTFIGRFVYKEKVYIYTRGMIETMAENDEQRQYFKWARDIISAKYHKIDDPNYLDSGTALFELIGPGNQIVTYYPNWDLVMTGFCLLHLGDDFENILANEINEVTGWDKFKYYTYDELNVYCNDYGFANPVTKLFAFGETIEEQIESINRLFSATDDEGSVIQFEHEDPEKPGRKVVVGRIKAKTDTYRKLLKLMNGCNYETISSLIKSDLKRFSNWENFKYHLMSLGSAQYPEELLNTYSDLFEEFWKHNMYAEKLWNEVYHKTAQILDKNKIKFEFSDGYGYKVDKNGRAEFAKFAQEYAYPGLLFSSLDGKLTAPDLRDKLFPTLSEIKDACKKLSIKNL